MRERPYLRELTGLSVPLRAAIAFGALAALTWLVLVTLDQAFDIDVDVLSPVLLLAMGAVVVSVGVELKDHRNKWIRAIGVLLIAAVAIAALLIALTIWFVAQLCENGCS